jgi:hypothetical protein
MIVRFDPDIKRLRTFIDKTQGIQLYTKNNLYPQIVEAVRDRSYTTKSAANSLANFIKGEGFEDQAFGSMEVNTKGKTMDDILSDLSLDAATFEGAFVVHLGTNMLGEYNNISVWPLNTWRLGLPDANGDVWHIKYNSNWEKDNYKQLDNREDIVSYDRFNPNKEDILEAIAEEGVENYLGQVFYHSKAEDQYPFATYDSVLDQAQTQEEIGIYRLSSIQNGLNAGYIFSYPGRFENTEKENQFKAGLDPMKGGKGAGSIIVVENPEGDPAKAADLITPLTLQNYDKLHEFISKDDKNAIMEAFAMPKGILGVLPETGMFNTQQMEEEYTYYNTYTRHLRTSVSNVFKKIMANWHQPHSENFKIKELTYGQASTSNAPRP